MSNVFNNVKDWVKHLFDNQNQVKVHDAIEQLAKAADVVDGLIQALPLDPKVKAVVASIEALIDELEVAANGGQK